MPYLEAAPAADTGTRQDHLFLVLDNLLAERTAWADGPDSQLASDDGFYRAVTETLELFGDGDIPGRLREVERTIRSLGDEWQEYLDRVEQFGDPNALPNTKFWKLIDHLQTQREEAEPAKRFHLESISELLAQKVNHAQICKIYGWVDAHGRPELWKLQEEIRTPGTHAGPDFVPPLEKARLAREARAKEIARGLRAKLERKVKTANEPARESVETLGRQGVFIRQIAKMKKMRPDEVVAELQAVGVDPIPPMDAADALARAGKVEHPEGEVGDARRRVDEALTRPVRTRPAPEPEQEFAADDSPADAYEGSTEIPGAEMLADDLDPVADPDGLEMLDASDREAAALGEQLGGMTIEQEIIALHQDNMPDKRISEAVGESIGKVRNTIKRYQKNPRAFES